MRYTTFINVSFTLALGITIGYVSRVLTQKTPLPFASEVIIIVNAPEDHADIVRDAMGRAGAGRIGNYGHCSFSAKGVGRFLALEGAHPAVGKAGGLESVNEETIQALCSIDLLEQVIIAIKQVHPYEELPIDIVPLYHFDYSKIKRLTNSN